MSEAVDSILFVEATPLDPGTSQSCIQLIDERDNLRSVWHDEQQVVGIFLPTLCQVFVQSFGCDRSQDGVPLTSFSSHYQAEIFATFFICKRVNVTDIQIVCFAGANA